MKPKSTHLFFRQLEVARSASSSSEIKSKTSFKRETIWSSKQVPKLIRKPLLHFWRSKLQKSNPFSAKNDGAKIAPQTSYIQGVMKDNTFQQSSPVSLSGSEQSSQLQSNQKGQTGQEPIQENSPSTPKMSAQNSPGEPLIKPKGKKRPVPAHQKDG